MAIVNHKGSSFLYASFQVNGVKHFFSTKTKNRATAKQIEARERERIIKEHMLGRELETITFGEALQKLIESKEGTPRGEQIKTIVNPLKGLKRDNKTKKQVKVFGLDFDQPIHLMKSSDINRLVEARKLEGSAPATIKQHVSVITGTLQFAKEMGYLVDEATKAPSIKLPKKEPVYLTSEEEQRLLDSLNADVERPGYGRVENRTEKRHQRLVDQKDFVLCLLDFGGRFNEIAQMRWEDVDFEAGSVFLRQFKTGKSTTVYMTDRVKEVLERRATNKTHEVYIFPNDERTSFRAYHPAWFKRACVRAGITRKITFHKTRSTFACRLVQNGASLFDVQNLLGHSSSTTTMVYAGLVKSEVSKKAVGILNALHAKV